MRTALVAVGCVGVQGLWLEGCACVVAKGETEPTWARRRHARGNHFNRSAKLARCAGRCRRGNLSRASDLTSDVLTNSALASSLFVARSPEAPSATGRGGTGAVTMAMMTQITMAREDITDRHVQSAFSYIVSCFSVVGGAVYLSLYLPVFWRYVALAVAIPLLIWAIQLRWFMVLYLR